MVFPFSSSIPLIWHIHFLLGLSPLLWLELSTFITFFFNSIVCFHSENMSIQFNYFIFMFLIIGSFLLFILSLYFYICPTLFSPLFFWGLSSQLCSSWLHPSLFIYVQFSLAYVIIGIVIVSFSLPCQYFYVSVFSYLIDAFSLFVISASIFPSSDNVVQRYSYVVTLAFYFTSILIQLFTIYEHHFSFISIHFHFYVFYLFGLYIR